MNRDFAEMLAALSAAGAEYLLVGAHALAAHGVVRATGDLDLWVRPTPDNAAKVWRALLAFGAPLHELTERDLATPDVLRNKRATGRLRDLADAEELEKLAT